MSSRKPILSFHQKCNLEILCLIVIPGIHSCTSFTPCVADTFVKLCSVASEGQMEMASPGNVLLDLSCSVGVIPLFPLAIFSLP